MCGSRSSRRAQDQFDTIDLSDNDIQKLGNFPTLRRLRTLLISNNRISRVDPELGKELPNLDTLVLANNRIVSLGEVDALAALPKLHIRGTAALHARSPARVLCALPHVP